MVYAYDQWAQMPTKDLYDSQMMLAAIQTAKDMYDKGEQAIKDFKKEYSDFYSPIQSDMDWYRDNVTGKIQNTLNSLYASGIDPTRSAEGRSIVKQAIDSIDPTQINFRKQRAVNAIEWQKNADKLKQENKFNRDFSNAIGESPENWSEDYIGNTSPTPYMDYESKYGHLFKDMDYEYDPVVSAQIPGMIAMTKNKSRMRDILSVNKQDLINDPQYQYDLQKIKDAIKYNPDLQNLSDEQIDAMSQQLLDNEIVQRNYKGGMKLETDPYSFRSSRSGGSRSSSGSNTHDPGDEYGDYDFATRFYQDMVSNVFGGSYAQYDPVVMGKEIRNTQKEFFNSVGDSAIDNPNVVINRFSMNEGITFNQFESYLEGNKVADENAIYLTYKDLMNLYDDKTLVSWTSGYNGEVVQYGRDQLIAEVEEYVRHSSADGYDAFKITPTGKTYGAQMRNGRFETFAQVILELDNTGHWPNEDSSTFRKCWIRLNINSNQIHNLDKDSQDLNPNFRNEHARATKSKNVNTNTWNQGATSKDTDIVPRVKYPQINDQ